MELNASKKIRMEEGGRRFRSIETYTKAGSDCGTARLRACILVASFPPFRRERRAFHPGERFRNRTTPVGRRATKLISSRAFLLEIRSRFRVSDLDHLPRMKNSPTKTYREGLASQNTHIFGRTDVILFFLHVEDI